MTTNEEQVRQAFGGKVKPKPKTKTKDIHSKDANAQAILAAFQGSEIVEAATGHKPTTKQDEKDLLEAFGGGPIANIYESFNPLILEESALEINDVNGSEEYCIRGTLADSDEKSLDKKHEYPQSTLQRIVNKKLWRNGQIFLSHQARNLRDIKKLCGKTMKMWMNGTKLAFEATLQKRKLDQIPGMVDALENRNLGVNMSIMGPRMKGNRVVGCDAVSLDLLGDLSHPNLASSGITSVQTV